MDDENETTITKAHRYSESAACSSSIGDWNSALSHHQLALKEFQQVKSEFLNLDLQLHTENQNEALLQTIDQLIQHHQQQWELISSTLAINSLPVNSLSTAQFKVHSQGRRQSVSSPAPGGRSIEPSYRSPPTPYAISGVHSPTLSTRPHLQQKQPASEQTILQIFQVIQLVQVFILSDSNMSSENYSRISGYVQDLLHLVKDLQSDTILHPSSAFTSASLTPAEEEQINSEMRQKLEIAEQLHQYLLSLKNEGMSAAQLQTFHQRFLALQQTQYQSLRSELLLQRGANKNATHIRDVSKALQEKLSKLESTLNHAARVASQRIITTWKSDEAVTSSAVNNNSAEIGKAIEQAIRERQLQYQNSSSGASAINESNAIVTTGGNVSSSMSDTAMKSVTEEKEKMAKQLAHLEREFKAERLLRLKAERAVSKHEEKWKQLNEKVAIKKAQQQQQQQGSGSPSASSTTSNSVSPSSSSTPSGGLSHIPERPSTLSSSSRSNSGGSAPPLTSARAVSITK